jgi:hypothetical protein
MNWANWAGLGLVGVAAVAIALASPIEAPISGEVNATEQIQTQAPEGVDEPSSPKRHQVTVNLVSPNDLKVKEGQRIKEGDVISDRTEARQQLEARKKQLEIAIAQMSLPLNPIASLPAPNLDSEQVALKKATFQLEQATKALNECLEAQARKVYLMAEGFAQKYEHKMRLLQATDATQSSLSSTQSSISQQ